MRHLDGTLKASGLRHALAVEMGSQNLSNHSINLIILKMGSMIGPEALWSEVERPEEGEVHLYPGV